MKALAKLHVDVYIDAESLYDAEKSIDVYLRAAEDDDRIVVYRVSSSEWVPEIYAPVPNEVES